MDSPNSSSVEPPPPSKGNESSNSPEYQKLSDRLHAFIAAGNFKAGDKLPPERALAETFGVSRNSVREAIRTLSEQGLLESRHGDGTYICEPDMEALTRAVLYAVKNEGHNFDHLMEFRWSLEPAIASLAAVRCTPEHIDRLKIIVCDQHRKLLSGEDDGELDAQFHSILAEATGNPVFIDTIARLNELFSTNRSPEVRLRSRRCEAIEEHLHIIDALVLQDSQACREAMERHIKAIAEKHFFKASRGLEC